MRFMRSSAVSFRRLPWLVGGFLTMTAAEVFFYGISVGVASAFVKNFAVIPARIVAKFLKSV